MPKILRRRLKKNRDRPTDRLSRLTSNNDQNGGIHSISSFKQNSPTNKRKH